MSFSGVTQPRRVAAISTARRVSDELSSPLGNNSIVGYQIRFDSKVGENTRIKFMTDGILLREVTYYMLNRDEAYRLLIYGPMVQVTNDLMLQDYNVIILDEAHERNINTDILLGMISRLIVKIAN